jgi:hypothetical protein
MQKLLPNFGLQQLNLPADGRLGYVQHRFGGRKASKARHMEKVKEPLRVQ